jgi:hypoxanthine phosphoribosyltransferase
MDIISDYLDKVFELASRERCLRQAQRILRGVTFDTVVVRGVSGLMFGSMLAYVMRKGVVVIRKKGESTHSSKIVEGAMPDPHERWLIVDDFLCTGETIRTIIMEMNYEKGFAGIYQFREGYFTSYPFDTEWARKYRLDGIMETYRLRNAVADICGERELLCS